MDKILIVNDSPSINMMLQFRLESEDFDIDTALSAQEGLEKARMSEYQLIILDYKLPGIHGSEVCKKIKGDNALKKIPVVFISAKDQDELARIVAESGADGFLSMPYAGEEFINTIKRFIDIGKEGKSDG